jgi:hypothetical protein
MEHQIDMDNQSMGVQDPNNNGGNNGVHGSPNPKPKANNSRNDKSEATL